MQNSKTKKTVSNRKAVEENGLSPVSDIDSNNYNRKTKTINLKQYAAPIKIGQSPF